MNSCPAFFDLSFLWAPVHLTLSEAFREPLSNLLGLKLSVSPCSTYSEAVRGPQSNLPCMKFSVNSCPSYSVWSCMWAPDQLICLKLSVSPCPTYSEAVREPLSNLLCWSCPWAPLQLTISEAVHGHPVQLSKSEVVREPLFNLLWSCPWAPVQLSLYEVFRELLSILLCLKLSVSPWPSYSAWSCPWVPVQLTLPEAFTEPPVQLTPEAFLRIRQFRASKQIITISTFQILS